MTRQPVEPDRSPVHRAIHEADISVRSLGTPNSIANQFDFWDDTYEGRRLFSEVLGTFFLVLVAVGGGMVSARFGGQAVPYGAKVVAPALMVMAIILFMGAVSGAHLNPAVSIAFALRGDFPWKRVPAYIVAQFLGAVLATLLLWAFLGKQGSAGLTLPGQGISTTSAMLWELVLTTGLVSVMGLPGQRRVDEPGPVPGACPGEERLELMVGLPGRADRRRGHRGRYRLRAQGPGRRPQRNAGGHGHAGQPLAPPAARRQQRQLTARPVTPGRAWRPPRGRGRGRARR